MIRVNSVGNGFDHIVRELKAPRALCGVLSFPDHWEEDHARGLTLCIDCRSKVEGK